MTKLDDLLKQSVPTDGQHYLRNAPNLTNSTNTQPWFGIQPQIHDAPGQVQGNNTNGMWTNSSSHATDNKVIQRIYRESFKGQVETLTQIVSDNADYLIQNIDIAIGATHTEVFVKLQKANTIPKFVFPNGEMNHVIAKKYMDWLAMVQLVLQDA